MADLSDSVNWSETDSSNNKASPLGWPEGMMPSGVNDSARADKGALKRFWDRINPIAQITPSGGVWTFITPNSAYPTAYANGEVYCFTPLADCAGGDQFQVNTLGAKPIFKRVYGTPAGIIAVAALDILNHLPVHLVYDNLANAGAGGFILLDPHLPITGDGTGGIITNSLSIIDLDGVSPFWKWYANGGTAHLMRSDIGDRLTVDGLGSLTAAGGLIAFGEVRASGSVFSGFDLYLGSQHILFMGNTSFTTGPYIAVDNASFTSRLGPGSLGWYFKDGSTGANAVSIQSNGTVFAAGEIHAAGSLFTNYDLHLGGQVIYFNGSSTTAGPYLLADNADWVLGLGPGFGSWFFRNSSGVNAVSIDNGGNIHAAGSLYTGVNLLLGNQVIFFAGNTNLAAGPLIQGNATDFGFRLGPGAGRFYFQNTGGTAVASIDVGGQIYATQLRGGGGIDAGVLRGAPNADPAAHGIAFGYDGVNQVFFHNIDGATNMVPFSSSIRVLGTAVDGGAPSGYRLDVYAGSTVHHLYIDYSTSDERLKRGIADSEVDALAVLCAVPVRRFEWRDEVQSTFGVPQGPVAIGLVAQDLLPHMPDCVGISEGRDAPFPADTHTLMHERFDAYFVRAIQQLAARVAELESR